MQNAMVMFTFPVFDRKYPFWANLVKKVKIISWNWNLVPRLTNSNMQNSMIKFPFSALVRQYMFWANLVQKIKMVSLRWNLILKPIQICRIQWWSSLFYIFGRKYSVRDQKYPSWENLVQIVNIYCLFCFWSEMPFLGKFGPKCQNCQFKAKFASLIRIWNKSNLNVQNSKVVFTDFVFGRKCPFLGKFGWKSQND